MLIIPDHSLVHSRGRHLRPPAGATSRTTASPGCILRRWRRSITSSSTRPITRSAAGRLWTSSSTARDGKTATLLMIRGNGGGDHWTQPFEGHCQQPRAPATARRSPIAMRWELEQYMSEHALPRLPRQSGLSEMVLARHGGRHKHHASSADMPITDELDFIDNLAAHRRKEQMIARPDSKGDPQRGWAF